MELWTPGVEDTTPSVSAALADGVSIVWPPEPVRFGHHLPHPSSGHPSASTVSALRDRSVHGPSAAGVTLIEVMVALIILTVGLLGVTALHGLGVKYGNRSYFRSQAVNQAYDILDRMRANPAGVATGQYMQSPSPTETGSNCLHSPCSISDFTSYDLVEWNTANNSLLPSGSGFVTTDGPTVSVVVSWQESGHSGKPETRIVRAAARL